MTKKNAPNHYYVVYGNEPFQREGYVRSAKANFEKIGWEIMDCTPHEFSPFLYPDFLQPEKLLVVVNMDNGDFDIESFLSHLENPEEGRCVLLHHRGGLNCKKPFKDVVKKVGKKAVKFEQPSDWSYEKETSAYAIKVAKGFGKELPKNLSLAISKKVGPNFGSIFFEIKKAVALADLASCTSNSAAPNAEPTPQLAQMHIWCLQRRADPAAARGFLFARTGPTFRARAVEGTRRHADARAASGRRPEERYEIRAA